MRFRSTSWLHLPALPLSASFDELSQFFMLEPEATLCAVLDYERRPIGYISLQTFQRLISTPYGYSLNQKKGVLGVMDHEPFIARLSDNAAAVFHAVADKSRLLRDGLILVHDDGTYAGCLNALGVFNALNHIHTTMLQNLEAQIQERERAERQIRLLADTDSLTRILNRRAFIREVEHLATGNAPFACAFIDLDRFKPLNDRYGHSVGDLVLKTVAQRLSDLRDCTHACRLGGDEFAFVVQHAGPDEALDVAERVHGAITGSVKTDIGDVSVGASIGIACFPQDASDTATLMHAADKAMIRSKSDGGGVAHFDRGLDLMHLDAEAFDNAVIAAIRANAFKPAVQPILDLRTRSISGYEVLARWPGSGFAKDPSPVQFIPIIERLGLMDSFFWSLVNQALRWKPQGDTFLSFNVSPSQLNSLEFVKRFHHTLQRHGVSPERVELEVTEHVLFRNIDASKKVLMEVVRHGTSLALDDFGTGYSALSLLEELPFNKIKLDKSLLGKSADLEKLPRVLTGSLKMCQELGLTSCVEGVETPCQLRQLVEAGCDLGQGYLIGKAVLCQDISGSEFLPLAS